MTKADGSKLKREHDQEAELRLPIMSISDLRVNSDGFGIRTLVFAAECPLTCRYCINNRCHNFPADKLEMLTVDELFDRIKSHRIYYWSSGGGLVFGGGEPLLYAPFILEFCKKYGSQINVTLETSLNVDLSEYPEIFDCVNQFIVDIKDMNPEIYQKYTGTNHHNLLVNLEELRSMTEKVCIRVPLIPDFNTEEDRENSVKILKEMGFTQFNLFRYVPMRRDKG